MSRDFAILINLAIVLLVACYSNSSPVDRAHWEGAIAQRLEYEALWEQSSAKELSNSLGKAFPVTIVKSGNLVAYCSLHLHRCSAIFESEGKLGASFYVMPCVASKEPCNDTEANIALSFLRLIRSSRKDLSEFLNLDTTTKIVDSWEASIHLKSLDELRSSYLDNRSPKMDSLIKWLQRERSDNREVVRLEVPCFRDSDPAIAVYVGYDSSEEDIISVRWNEESRSWEFTSFYKSPFNHEDAQVSVDFEDYRRLISSFACFVK